MSNLHLLQYAWKFSRILRNIDVPNTAFWNTKTSQLKENMDIYGYTHIYNFMYMYICSERESQNTDDCYIYGKYEMSKHMGRKFTLCLKNNDYITGRNA